VGTLFIVSHYSVACYFELWKVVLKISICRARISEYSAAANENAGRRSLETDTYNKGMRSTNIGMGSIIKGLDSRV
jgi:hypothetical protein